MHEVSNSGRTIVFVSHQMNQIRRLCERVYWLDGGQIYKSGSTGAILGEYESASGVSQQKAEGRSNGNQSRTRFLDWRIHGTQSEVPHILTTMGTVQVHFTVEVTKRV